MTSSQSSRLMLRVSVTRGLSDRVCGPSSFFSSRTCGPSPRLTATRVGCAGNADRLGATRSPATSVGRGRVTVSVGGDLCCTTRCGAVHEVAGSPSVAAYADPRTSTTSESPWARVVFGSAIRSASLGPCRGRTHTIGVTDTGAATVRVRLKLTGSSGANAIEGAQRTPSGAPAQPGLPSSSDPRSQSAIAEPGGGPGTRTVCRRLTGWANPDESYWVIDRSVMPNCTPADPSSVPAAVIRTHGVSP